MNQSQEPHTIRVFSFALYTNAIIYKLALSTSISMEFCASDEVEYSGALVKVEVYTTSEYLCERIKSVLSSRSFSEALGIVKDHGGCTITSRNPLVVESCDGEIKVVVRAGNFLARLGWGKAVSKAESYCSGC